MVWCSKTSGYEGANENRFAVASENRRSLVTHTRWFSLETGGNGTTTPAPAPVFGGGLFGAQKPAENKDAPKPGR